MKHYLPTVDLNSYFLIVGDVAHQIQEQSDSALFIEVVQTCAVYFAWAEAIHLNNRDKWKF